MSIRIKVKTREKLPDKYLLFRVGFEVTERNEAYRIRKELLGGRRVEIAYNNTFHNYSVGDKIVVFRNQIPDGYIIHD